MSARRDEPPPATTDEAGLARRLSLPLTTLYGLGNILGAGIYVLVGEVAGLAGAYAPMAFVVAGALAGLAAFTYVELTSRFPLSSGGAAFVHEAFGIRRLSVAVGLLIMGVGIAAAATVARGFVGYFQVLVPAPAVLVIVVVVFGLGALAAWGIRESAGVAALFTLIETFGLLLVIWATRHELATLPARVGEMMPPAVPGAWHGILAGGVLAFFAFTGFEDMVTVAEEVRDAPKNMPRAIVLALAISAVLYMLVMLGAVLAIPPVELAGSDAPLGLIYERMVGASPALIALIGTFAVVNGALVQIVMASRMLYGMSRQGWLPARLGTVARRTRTPVLATGLVTGIVLLLALAFPVVQLAEATSFLLLVNFSIMSLSLCVIKRRGPAPAGARTVPAWVPAVGFVASLAFISFQVVTALHP